MRNRWRPLRVALAAVAIAGAAVMSAWTTAAAVECEGVVLDDGCLFTVTGSDTPDPDDGYAVTNAHGVPFYDFVRARDLHSDRLSHQPAVGQRGFHLPSLPEGDLAVGSR